MYLYVIKTPPKDTKLMPASEPVLSGYQHDGPNHVLIKRFHGSQYLCIVIMYIRCNTYCIHVCCNV